MRRACLSPSLNLNEGLLPRPQCPGATYLGHYATTVAYTSHGHCDLLPLPPHPALDPREQRSSPPRPHRISKLHTRIRSGLIARVLPRSSAHLAVRGTFLCSLPVALVLSAPALPAVDRGVSPPAPLCSFPRGALQCVRVVGS